MIKLTHLLETMTPADFETIDWPKMTKTINSELNSNLKLEFALTGYKLKVKCSNLSSQLGFLNFVKNAKFELEEVSFNGKYKFMATLKLRLNLTYNLIHIGTMAVLHNGTYMFIPTS